MWNSSVMRLLKSVEVVWFILLMLSEPCKCNDLQLAGEMGCKWLIGYGGYIGYDGYIGYGGYIGYNG